MRRAFAARNFSTFCFAVVASKPKRPKKLNTSCWFKRLSVANQRKGRIVNIEYINSLLSKITDLDFLGFISGGLPESKLVCSIIALIRLVLPLPFLPVKPIRSLANICNLTLLINGLSG